MLRMFRICLLCIGIFGFSFVYSDPESWQVDYARSQVSFVAVQAGAEFEGHLNEWDADVRFDPSNLDESSATARFQVATIQTLDPERDETLQERDWFDGAVHPVATYQTNGFKALPDGRFEADSTLTVKGVSVPITFRFHLTGGSNERIIEGEAEVDRLAASLGVGEWADTAWIGQFVRVKVLLHAKVPVR